MGLEILDKTTSVFRFFFLWIGLFFYKFQKVDSEKNVPKKLVWKNIQFGYWQE